MGHLSRILVGCDQAGVGQGEQDFVDEWTLFGCGNQLGKADPATGIGGGGVAAQFGEAQEDLAGDVALFGLQAR